MSGFDNGTLHGGVFAQTNQFGSILWGSGPPVPGLGVLGSLYMDTLTYFLYAKRGNNLVSPWGNYLFLVPVTYQAALKWFGSSRPSSTIGVDGDYYLLWGGYGSYGMQPSIYGPKAAGAWPANPAAVAVDINPLYTAENEHAV